MEWQVLALLLVALVTANLPFISERLLLLISVPPQKGKKHFAWQLLELLVWYGLVGAFALWLESNTAPVHPQKWQFYATTFSLFLVLAFPGFVLRYFWRWRKPAWQ